MDKDFLKGLGLSGVFLGISAALTNKSHNRLNNPKTNDRGITYLTNDEVEEVTKFILTIKSKVPKKLITNDRGSSILGNGIEVYGVSGRERKPRYFNIWSQTWTQAEQPDAVGWILEKVYEKFPSYIKCIFYDAGRMD